MSAEPNTPRPLIRYRPAGRSQRRLIALNNERRAADDSAPRVIQVGRLRVKTKFGLCTNWTENLAGLADVLYWEHKRTFRTGSVTDGAEPLQAEIEIAGPNGRHHDCGPVRGGIGIRERTADRAAVTYLGIGNEAARLAKEWC